MIELQIGIDGKVDQQSIILGNKFENQDEQIHFNLPPEFDSYNKYIIAVYRQDSGDITKVLPVNDNIFIITSTLTHKSGRWYLYLMCRQHELNLDVPEVDISAQNGEHVFISDGFIGMVATNYIDKNLVDNTPLDANLKVVYDDLLTVKQEVETKLASGAFDGKDGYSPTLDVTPIDNGNRITINDINGEKEIDVTNGIDGQSAYELAVKNGFEGTEQEWLESLRYDHSEEFTKLAEQVKLDANSAADSATKAENAMNEANTTAQENVEAINQASTNAQNAITTTKDNAVQAVQSAQQTAENAISTKQTEAVQAVDTAKTSATQEITEQKESTVSAITQEKNSAIEAIETGRIEALNDIATDKTGALTAIETAKDEAIEEIENTGVPLEDIEKLAIKETAEGNPTIINDSADWRLQSLNVYGQSSQDGTPTPENPVEIISKEVSEIIIKKSLNLFDKSKIEKLKTITNDGNIEANGSSHVSGYISVKPNTMYSMTGTNQTRGKFYTSDKKGIGMDYNFNPSKDTTFQTDENTYFIQFCLPASQDGSNIMLNEGDTLYSIARQYNVNITDLVKLNNIKNANLITIGQVIYLT